MKIFNFSGSEKIKGVRALVLWCQWNI